MCCYLSTKLGKVVDKIECGREGVNKHDALPSLPHLFALSGFRTRF
jgi:hypothetical protein